MNDLGTLGGNFSYAYDINDLNYVVGTGETAAAKFHAFVYDGSSMIDLGTLGGDSSTAYGINNFGQTVGVSQTGNNFNQAFFYDGSQMINLNSVTNLVGSSFSTLVEARAINNSGQIVGYGITTNGSTQAFLLTPISLSAVPEPSTYAAICALGLLGLAGWRTRQRLLTVRNAPSDATMLG